MLMPNTSPDPEYTSMQGLRSDSRDLIQVRISLLNKKPIRKLFLHIMLCTYHTAVSVLLYHNIER